MMTCISFNMMMSHPAELQSHPIDIVESIQSVFDEKD